ncbi:PAS domain S-box protein [Cellulophaga sp. F20128]|uniref:PAS domain S-box protein n=1 Tax=Cellulophaga sp. F20128 TaxID=2926413 RepID=UPI001FF2E554|nr:PAS domain S-box protein [Cellulophaga sp. F20128]MCK0156797.1 PAS domain S-box protein [Cellulophaga sp. F20128]
MDVLEKELKDLVKKDNKIFNFIENHVLDGIWYWNIENCNHLSGWLNDTFWKTLGYSLKEIKEQNITLVDVCNAEDMVRGEQNLHLHISNPKKYPFDENIRYTHKEGHTIWLNVKGTIVYTKENKPFRMLGTHTSITKLKEAKSKLQDKVQYYENVISGVGIGSWEYNIKTGHIKFNDCWAELFGYTPEEQGFITATKWKKYLHPDDIQIINDAYEKHLVGGPYSESEFRLKHKDGHWVWIVSRARIILYDTDGNPEIIAGLNSDITERKVNEQLQIKNSDLMQRINDAARIGIWEVNLETNIIYWNDTIKEMLGVPKDYQPTLDDAYLFFQEGEHRKHIISAIVKGISTGENFDFEALIAPLDNAVFWGRVIGISEFKNGQCKRLYGFFQDINEQTKTTKELLNYKTLLERSNEVAKIGSWEVDPETQEVYYGDSLTTLLVAERNQYNLEDSILKNIKGNDQEWVKAIMNKALTQGDDFDIELQLQGHNRHFWARIIGISDFEDGKCKKLYGLIQDIDASKKLELELSLREEQFRQTFWYANVGMTLFNLEGKITSANPSVCRTFGFSEEELLKIPIAELSHPDDLATSQELMRELIAGERDNFQIEKRYFHKNGKAIWVFLSTSSVKNDQGKVSHFVSQIQDITENKKLTESLQEHNNRLLNFAHIVSHNLRSHTGNMAMLLDINKVKNGNTMDHEIFQHIKSASDNMSDTVNHLTEIVEINSQVKESLVPKNLSNYVARALQNIKHSIEEHQIEIQLDVDPQLTVRVVPAYLESILLNLLTNAIKYRALDRPCTIKITTEVSEKFISLAIIDNGLGIDLEKNGDRLFGMYKTFHEHKEARGIGLFISKNQIEAMGGKIEVSSRVDKGSTFKIQFKYEYND